MDKPVADDPSDPNITMTLAGRELTIRDRYETASIVNDVLIALEFFVGSFFFFEIVEEYASKDIGVWLFVIGSAQLMIRPAIRLARRVTLRRMAEDAAAQRSGSPGTAASRTSPPTGSSTSADTSTPAGGAGRPPTYHEDSHDF